MKKIVYSLDAGRVILKNGTAIMTLNHVTDNGMPRLCPADADIFAHRVVNALNHMELIRQRKVK
jgi:hypothetical protein